jgi:hypothetical protein
MKRLRGIGIQNETDPDSGKTTALRGSIRVSNSSPGVRRVPAIVTQFRR